MSKKLLIIGGGPAGLSAAINAASEGIDVTILDKAAELGGQFKESNAIANYPGFPAPVKGCDLSGAMIEQASRFGVTFCCPVTAAGLEQTATGFKVTADDWRTFEADAVILAQGLQWRKLEAPGVDPLMGRGVSYGSQPITDNLGDVAIVGGGNSAGQEAVKLADNPGRKVYVIVRKTLDEQMSSYLIQQIAQRPNITVYENAAVQSAFGIAGSVELAALAAPPQLKLGSVMIKSLATPFPDYPPKEIPVSALMLYIGATPHTYWLKGSGVDLDPQGFIVTGEDMAPPFETSIHGVFAIGDARQGSCKRIGAAVGEGSTVVPYVHKFFATNQ